MSHLLQLTRFVLSCWPILSGKSIGNLDFGYLFSSKIKRSRSASFFLSVPFPNCAIRRSAIWFPKRSQTARNRSTIFSSSSRILLTVPTRFFSIWVKKRSPSSFHSCRIFSTVWNIKKVNLKSRQYFQTNQFLSRFFLKIWWRVWPYRVHTEIKPLFVIGKRRGFWRTTLFREKFV